ncbi:AAC(3) family N-acetyltransferase [Desulfosporosinus acididurans]|uniref:AAC(3) family N-acetyltransferase n=1 Tax=Desulfosporosinus acididurans TaxID=476652 RepID=UPI00069A64A2|nr:AAC(3) family N-acetyltransferase [Desulfosporosinus acididurans]
MDLIQSPKAEFLTPLFTYNDAAISSLDFVKALQNLGITKGDTVYMTSDIAVFGKLAVFNRQFLLDSIIEAVIEVVGDQGTIIMPTFSYSFCNGESFNVAESKSTVGVLTEHFRQRSDVKRTVQPIFSAAVWGEKQDFFMNIGHDSFDNDSIFGKLRRVKGKFVCLGAPFHSCTYIHHIEQMHGCNYRYIKTFSGTIINDDQVYEDSYTFFVRYLGKNVNLDTNPLEKHLLSKGLLDQVTLGNGIIQCISSEELFAEGCKLLDSDPYFFLEGEPNL